MIDRNPERDLWQRRYFQMWERWHTVGVTLARKSCLPPPEDQCGSFSCPYCYFDEPHSAQWHDVVSDAIDALLQDGLFRNVGRKSEELRTMLRVISRQCREHGERFELAEKAAHSENEGD